MSYNTHGEEKSVYKKYNQIFVISHVIKHICMIVVQ